MARMPDVPFLDITSSARMRRYDIVCIHTIVGFQAGGNAAHFTTGASGKIVQARDTVYQSAANYFGNYRVIAIENEDHGSAYGSWDVRNGHAVPPFTDAQCEAIAKICAWAYKAHGIPLALCPDSRTSSRGIAYHRQGIDGNFSSYAYGGRVSGGELWTKYPGKVCPGDRRIRQLIEVIIPRARVLAGMDPAPTPTTPAFEQDDAMNISLYPAVPTDAEPNKAGYGVKALPGPAHDPGSKIWLTTGWGQEYKVRVWFLGQGDKRYLNAGGGNGLVLTATSDNPDWAPIPSGTVAIHAEWTSTEEEIPGDLAIQFVPQS